MPGDTTETYNPKVFVHHESYRVWSLTGQGYLTLTTKNEVPSVQCSGTGKEDSSIITAHELKSPGKLGFWLEFQKEEDGKKYALDASTDNDTVSVKEFSCPRGNKTKETDSQSCQDGEAFCVKHFGSGDQSNGSLFKALIPLGKEDKCIALNSKNELSLEKFDKYSPPPHTIFFITKAN